MSDCCMMFPPEVCPCYERQRQEVADIVSALRARQAVLVEALTELVRHHERLQYPGNGDKGYRDAWEAARAALAQPWEG